MQRFTQERFQLAPGVQGYELDQEVAARIATGVFAADPSTWNGGNNRQIPIMIDPTNKQPTHAVVNSDSEDSDRQLSYNVGFNGEIGNRDYAREMRKAFLDAERQDKMEFPGSLVMSGLVVAAPEGVVAGIDIFGNLSGTNAAYTYAAGAVAGISGLVANGDIKHLLRLRTIRPNTRANRRHVQAAAGIAEILKLPPVVTRHSS